MKNIFFTIVFSLFVLTEIFGQQNVILAVAKKVPNWIFTDNFKSTRQSELQKAFPGAEGFGAYSRGGRGGKVLFVTNLNDSGPGSLREAVDTEGPRTIIFRVSGTINLKSTLQIRQPFLTIAGQTAPGDGICIKGHKVVVDAHDCIVRYIRIRLGDEENVPDDAFSTYRGAKNTIIDHCSASWAVDETMSATYVKNVTFQWCIISESLNNSVHPKGKHGYGSLINGEEVTYHHNLYAHHSDRVPRPAACKLDFINNVLYDFGGGGYNHGEATYLELCWELHHPSERTERNFLYRPETGRPKDAEQNLYGPEFQRWFRGRDRRQPASFTGRSKCGNSGRHFYGESCI